MKVQLTRLSIKHYKEKQNSYMKIICRQNCSGKTKELIKESLDTNTPILVFSPTKRGSLEEKSVAYFN